MAVCEDKCSDRSASGDARLCRESLHYDELWPSVQERLAHAMYRLTHSRRTQLRVSA